MLSCLEIVKNTLESVTEKCFHYEAVLEDHEKDRYIVWAEDNEYNERALDNWKQLQGIEGTIDYFSTDGMDVNFTAIPKALNRAGIAWRLSSVQYEDETGFIHYEWVFRVRQSYEVDGS